MAIASPHLPARPTESLAVGGYSSSLSWQLAITLDYGAALGLVRGNLLSI